MRAADPDEYLDMDDSDVDDFEAVPGRNAAVLTCARVHLEDNSMFSSAKRACAIPPPVSRIPTQPDIEMGTVSLLVPEDAMEVDFDAGVEPALVRRGGAMWEERADQTNMDVCPDTAGECCNRDVATWPLGPLAPWPSWPSWPLWPLGLFGLFGLLASWPLGLFLSLPLCLFALCPFALLAFFGFCLFAFFVLFALCAFFVLLFLSFVFVNFFWEE